MNTLEKLYVTLDAVLDLRQGVLNFLSSDFAFAVTTQSGYFLREEDNFSSAELSPVNQQPWGELPQVDVQRLLQAHPYQVMRASMRTRIDKFINHLCAAHFQNSLAQGFEPSIKIELNVHGYHLTEEEAKTIEQSFQAVMGKFFRVTVINVAPIHMTPDVMRENFFGMVMYDYVTWANLHGPALQKKPLSTSCLYVPRIRFNGPFPPEQLEICQQRNVSPWELLQQVYAPILPTQYIPVAFFCVAVPQNLEEYTAGRAA